METTTSARMRKSEFFYKGEHADDLPLSILESDKTVFELLHPERGFHILPGPWIADFIGRPYARNFDHRLSRLARAPHNYLLRYKQDRRISKDSAYARAPKADTVMQEKPHYQRDELAHRILEDLTQASIELGVRDDANFRISKWHQVPHSDAVKKIAAKGNNPHRIELKDGHLLPDGKPFRIESHGEHLYVLGKEIDRRTEPLKSTAQRRSIAEKFHHYKEVYDKKLWRTYYGFDNAVVLFITIDEQRMNAMMDYGQHVFGPSCKYIGFTCWDDHWNAIKYSKPSDTMFTRPWKRIGERDVHLNRLWR